MTEMQFDRIINGIIEDRETIIKHNPIGTPEETLLWMLLGALVSYLSVPDNEMPCFTGIPDSVTYRNAIKHILAGRLNNQIDIDERLNRLT